MITSNSIFFDANGQCLDMLIDKNNTDYELSFAKTFHKEVVDNATVLYVDKKNNSLFGWYRNATLYMQFQYHMPTQREYRAICKTQDAFLLSKANRLTLPVVLPDFKDFWIADKQTAIELVSFADTSQKKLQFVNLSLDISEERYRDELVEKDAKYIFEQYQTTGDVFLLQALYQNALNWSVNEPINAAPWDYLGLSLLELARPQEALPHFERAIKIDPMYKSSCRDKGECLIRLERIEDAVHWLNEVIERMPDDDIRAQLSDAYLLAGFPGISYRLLKEIQSEEYKEAILPVIKEREQSMPYLLNPNPDYSVLDAYPLFLDFKNEPLPELYEDAHGMKRYIDPIRQKGIPVTPEETVRQKVISYLQRRCGIPSEAMFVEESLAHIDRELRDRVDILVGHMQGGQRKYILLVECKAPEIALEGEPTAQVLRYNTVLQAPFALLTNGDVSNLYHFSADTGKFEALRELPSYKEMCASANIKYVHLQSVHWMRPVYATLSQPDVLQKYTWEGLLGEDTPPELASFILNLALCLLDEAHKVECPLSVAGCTIQTDYGVIPMTTGNAGGGKYFGNFRWFGILDRQGNRQNAYVAVLGTGKSTNDSHWGTRAGVSTMVFAIEEKGKATSRLQISLDTCLILDGDGYRLTHTGVRSRGKIQPLLEFIKSNVPDLLGTEERIMCGWLDGTKNLYLSDVGVAETIGKAISYLLLRSEYRLIEKQDKKSK